MLAVLLSVSLVKLEERSNTESRRFCLKPEVNAMSDEKI